MADIEALISKAARRYHINRNILRAQLNQESGLKEGLTSSAGARDIAQFIPSTAREYGVTLGDNNPTDDIMGAAHMDSDNLKRYGSYQAMLSAYNSGSPTAYKDPGFAGGQTTNYVKTIMAAAGNPKASAPSSVSGGSSSGASGSETTIPGTSYQPQRAAAIGQWLQSRDMPGSLLTLANSLNQIPQDIPDQTMKAPAAPTVSSSPTPSGGGATKDPSGKKVADWIEPILEYARQHGWKGGVESGYRSLAEQTKIYNSGARPAAKPGTSNHEFTAYPGGAVDVTDAQQLSDILMKSPYGKKLVYAGSKDPVHFSHPHNGSY